MAEEAEALQVARSTAKGGEGVMQAVWGPRRSVMSSAQTSRQQSTPTSDDLHPSTCSPVRWCDGEQSKVSMQELWGKITGSRIGNGGNRGGNGGLTRAGRGRQSHRYGGRRLACAGSSRQQIDAWLADLSGGPPEP
jgi:hypothetical protein